MSDSRVVVRLSQQSIALVRAMATKRDEDLGTTADVLIGTGYSRLMALGKYAKKQSAQAARRPKKKGPPAARMTRRKRALKKKLERRAKRVRRVAA